VSQLEGARGRQIRVDLQQQQQQQQQQQHE
jgi:hypothetical protein